MRKNEYLLVYFRGLDATAKYAVLFRKAESFSSVVSPFGQNQTKYTKNKVL
jgi:hypothetical protein